MDEKQPNSIEALRANPRHRLLRLCLDRDIPYDTFIVWLDKLHSLDTDSQRDDYAARMVDYIDRHYPLMPREEFLQLIDQSENWEKCRNRFRIYWGNLKEMFMDVVRLGMHRIVEETAPHCLFDNASLQEECLHIAPNEATRDALKKHVLIGKDQDYAHYPFCCVYNERYHKHGYRLIDFRLLSMPDDLQEKLWDSFLKEFIHGTEEEFFKYMSNTRDTWNLPRDVPHRSSCAHFLYAMGYELSPSGFIREPIFDYWLTSEYSDAWSDYAEKLRAGLFGMLALMKEIGWNISENRVNNYFGDTGYVYLKDW